MLLVLPMLPCDIDELAMDPADRLARRRAGHGEWKWSPVNVERLVGRRVPSDDMPFMVVFTSHEDAARRVSIWRRGLPLCIRHDVSRIWNATASTPIGLYLIGYLAAQTCRQAANSDGRIR
jgi:hypothetical protein